MVGIILIFLTVTYMWYVLMSHVQDPLLFYIDTIGILNVQFVCSFRASSRSEIHKLSGGNADETVDEVRPCLYTLV